MRENLRKSKGAIGIEIVVAVVILSIYLSFISVIVLNIFNAQVSSHKNAVSLNYIIEILQQVEFMDYNDTKIANGTYTKNLGEVGNILGVQISENYSASMNIQDFNKTTGNENKEDIIKIVTVNITYEDNGLNKNLEIKTLKYKE